MHHHAIKVGRAAERQECVTAFIAPSPSAWAHGPTSKLRVRTHAGKTHADTCVQAGTLGRGEHARRRLASGEGFGGVAPEPFPEHRPGRALPKLPRSFSFSLSFSPSLYFSLSFPFSLFFFFLSFFFKCVASPPPLLRK